MFAWDVVGEAAPKGSGRAMLVKGRAIHVASANKGNERRMKSWRREVIDSITARPPPRLLEGPLVCAVVFRSPPRKGDLTPTGVPTARAPFHPCSAPDVDKLLRGTFDAITDSRLVWHDDGQVAVAQPAKVYCPPGVAPGALIIVGSVDELLPIVRHWLERIATLQGEMDWARAPGRARRPAGQESLL